MELEDIDKKQKFQWSLKPLTLITRVAVGVPIYFNTNRIASKKSVGVYLLIIFIGIFIFLTNVLINGPRRINKEIFYWMIWIQNYDSPFTCFREIPDALLQFVVDVTFIMFFIVVPLMQFVFLFTVFWSRQWSDLVYILKRIENEMKLSEKFYRKCRNQCIIALLLILVCKENVYH